jgi:murein DD-endopeptidase MepM/ murein hydrolase activator NlpD
MFDYQSPIPGAKVSHGWGEDRSYRERADGAEAWHEGLDFAVPDGTPVRAAASGVVSFSGLLATDPAGNIITLDHADGTRTRYMHLSQRLAQKGQQVSAGQIIGASGHTGIKISAAHLHFDVRANTSALASYKAQFGTPKRPSQSTGALIAEFGRNIGGFVGIPAEGLVPADYAPAVLALAARQGIPLYTDNRSTLLVGLALVGGLYLLYEYA